VLHFSYPYIKQLHIIVPLAAYIAATAAIATVIHVGFTEPANQWLRKRLLGARARAAVRRADG